MADKDFLYVDCDKHGRGIAAVVCRHLCDDQATSPGFVENSSEPGDKQAWCLECEALFLEEGELTETFRKFNDMALVCEACYEIIRSRNAKAD